MKQFNGSEYLKANYSELSDGYARYIEREQLLDEAFWNKFVQVFRDRSDISDDGWRSEYWGKMMRGACMTYRYTKSEELYAVLTRAVEGLLSAQDELGRMTGYTVEREFRGWDMWGRKYVLVGLEYFYSICRDEELKQRILTAMCRQADYIVQKVGSGEGQLPVTRTSICGEGDEAFYIWGGLNACTILEPFVELYKLTEKADYLRFAEHVISTGGSTEANLIALVDEGKLPYEFPVTKAYEMMSFFEGLLAYYEVTGKKEFLETVQKFVRAVQKSDITVIGCAGCTHELFDNAALRQTEYSETIMQETCVTVTWMRLVTRLWENTNEALLLDWVEQSARNALFGSINTNKLAMYSFEKKTQVPPLPFDSYSPLYYNMRGRGVGGFKEFPSGGNYGCCACIGAAGTALYPLYALVKKENTFYWNFYLSGEAEGKTQSGQAVKFVCQTDYPAAGEVCLTLSIASPEAFALAVRIPAWAKGAELLFNGRAVNSQSGYCLLEREWKEGDNLTLRLPLALRAERLNGKTAFTFGALVLARDEQKEEGDITEFFAVGTELAYTLLPAEEGEQLRLVLRAEGRDILLTDYASCGKNWAAERNRISAWLNVK